MIKVFLFVSLFIASSMYAQENTHNATNLGLIVSADKSEHNIADTKSTEKVIKKELSFQKQTKINILIKQKELLEASLKENNIWAKIYSNYHTYQELKKQKVILDDQITILDNKYQRTEAEQKAFDKLKGKRSILAGKLPLLNEYENNPFKKFLSPPEITDIPRVGNPFEIISALQQIHVEEVFLETPDQYRLL